MHHFVCNNIVIGDRVLVDGCTPELARRLRGAGFEPVALDMSEFKTLLTKEQEQHLFRKMNFLKHQARQLQKGIDADKARATDMYRLEELLKASQKVKDQLINANMRLVASIAKKHARPTDNFFELLSILLLVTAVGGVYISRKTGESDSNKEVSQ